MCNVDELCDKLHLKTLYDISPELRKFKPVLTRYIP